MSLIKRIISFGSAFVFVLGLGLAVPATSNAAGINDKVCSGINTVLDGTGTVGSGSDCTQMIIKLQKLLVRLSTYSHLQLVQSQW